MAETSIIAGICTSSYPIEKFRDSPYRDGNGRGGDMFCYPILISVKTIHQHPYTQTQPVSNFCLIPISTG